MRSRQTNRSTALDQKIYPQNGLYSLPCGTVGTFFHNHTHQHRATVPPLWQPSHWCNPQAFQITPVGVTFYTNLQRVSFPRRRYRRAACTPSQCAHEPHSTDEPFPGEMLSVSIPPPLNSHVWLIYVFLSLLSKWVADDDLHWCHMGVVP